MPINSLTEFIIYMLLVVPCVYDGYRQYYLKIESNNYRRLITGGLVGFALIILIKSYGVSK